MIGSTRALLGAGAVVILAAGVGIGTALAGSSSKADTPAVTAATSSVSTAAPFTLSGTFTLGLGAFQWNRAVDGSAPCTGFQGYSDITAGAPVVITDQAGTVVATGQLKTGSATVDASTGHATACAFSFAVQAVPDRTFYGVTVSHRGTQNYSAAQARAGAVSLSLG